MTSPVTSPQALKAPVDRDAVAGRPALEGEGGNRVVSQLRVKRLGDGSESGWGAGGGGYKNVTAAVGVGGIRLERIWRLPVTVARMHGWVSGVGEWGG